MKFFSIIFFIVFIKFQIVSGQEIGTKYIIPEVLFDDVEAIRIYKYNEAENLDYKIDEIFDYHGNIVKVEKFSATDLLIKFSETSYPRDDTKEIITYSKYGDIRSKIVYLFNDDVLYEINEYELIGLWAKYTFSYDNNLKINRIQKYFPEKLTWTYEFEYDSLGRLLNEKMYNMSINWLFKYQYDKYDNVLKIERYFSEYPNHSEYKLKETSTFKYYYDE